MVNKYANHKLKCMRKQGNTRLHYIECIETNVSSKKYILNHQSLSLSLQLLKFILIHIFNVPILFHILRENSIGAQGAEAIANGL